MSEHAWKLQDAKNQFSAVVEAAESGIPQYVTKRGKRSVVVVDADHFDEMAARAQESSPVMAGDILLSGPQSKTDEELFPRLNAKLRPIEF